MPQMQTSKGMHEHAHALSHIHTRPHTRMNTLPHSVSRVRAQLWEALQLLDEEARAELLQSSAAQAARVQFHFDLHSAKAQQLLRQQRPPPVPQRRVQVTAAAAAGGASTLRGAEEQKDRGASTVDGARDPVTADTGSVDAREAGGDQDELPAPPPRLSTVDVHSLARQVRPAGVLRFLTFSGLMHILASHMLSHLRCGNSHVWPVMQTASVMMSGAGAAAVAAASAVVCVRWWRGLTRPSLMLCTDRMTYSCTRTATPPRQTRAATVEVAEVAVGDR